MHNMPQFSMTDFDKEFFALSDGVKAFARTDLKVS
jgi:hypothetical protein